MTLIEAIEHNHVAEAKRQIIERLDVLRDKYMVRMKSMVGDKLAESPEALDEKKSTNILRRGRMLLIRRRIRKGKLQRNIRRSALKGFRLKKGRVVRIPSAERIRMKIKGRRAAIKRRGKLRQALRKRKISLRKRKAMGIH